MAEYNKTPDNWAAKNKVDHGNIHEAQGTFPEHTFNDAGMALAMSYVKRQKWGKLLDCDTGLAEGTIFPALVKPFLGQGGNSR